MNVSPANTRLAILGMTLIVCAACASTPPDTASWPPWAEKAPGPEDYLRVYPKKAKQLGAESSVRLTCTIKRNRRLDCETQWEQHPGQGFGQAALKVSKLYVVKKSIEPEIQPGKIVIVPIAFRLSD
jgi:Gram-negative bacterial TonB protein C-terminal